MDNKKIAIMLEVLAKSNYSQDDVLEFARKVVGSPEEVFDGYETKADLECRIGMILDELGILLELDGYKYLIKAIELVYYDLEMPEDTLVSDLYREISKEFKVPILQIRKNIADAIDRAWNMADYRIKEKYFGIRAGYKKMKDVQFMNVLVEYLKSHE